MPKNDYLYDLNVTLTPAAEAAHDAASLWGWTDEACDIAWLTVAGDFSTVDIADECDCPGCMPHLHPGCVLMPDQHGCFGPQ